MALGDVVTDIKPTFTVNCSNSDMPDIVGDARGLRKHHRSSKDSGFGGRRQFGDLLARPAYAANCDMLEDGINGQRIHDSLTNLQLQ